jgi:hypothetical protein
MGESERHASDGGMQATGKGWRRARDRQAMKESKSQASDGKE